MSVMAADDPKMTKLFKSGFSAGDELGDYLLEKRIGIDGLCETFRAIRQRDELTVAVRLPLSTYLNEPPPLTWTQSRELWRRLEHPNVVRLIETQPVPQSEWSFVVMEHLEGDSIHDIINADGPFEQKQALELLREICKGLHAIHSSAEGSDVVAHRDIKPLHIMVDNQGGPLRITGLDLMAQVPADGIAWDGAEAGTLCGTPHYMAPEVIQGRGSTARSDLYSLGIAAFEMLTGSVPFKGETELDLFREHQVMPLPDVRDSVPKVSAGLAALINTLCDKDPERRPPNAREVISQLRALSEGADPLANRTSMPPPLPSKDGATRLPTLSGPYRALKELSSNTRSRKVRGEHTGTGEPVLIKLVAAGADAAELNERLLHAAALSRALIERGVTQWIVPVLDLGTWQKRPYVVEPWLEGWSLARARRGLAALAPAAAMAVLEGCLKGLNALHGSGVVHGNLCPEHVFVTTDRSPDELQHYERAREIKLLDLQCARRLDGPENEPGSPLYSQLAYLAPEAARGEPLSPQSDLYSLGVVMYELLVGARPYEVRSLEEVARLPEGIIPPMPLRLEIPLVVEELLRSLLAVDPARRIPSATDALSRLQRLIALYRWMSREVEPTILETTDIASTQPRGEPGVEEVGAESITEVVDEPTER